jgi:hypothetical protein
VDEEDCVEFEEHYLKFYDAEKLAGFLSLYVKPGEIRCWGDEIGDCWRIVFDGAGNYEVQPGRIVYEGRMRLPDEGAGGV